MNFSFLRLALPLAALALFAPASALAQKNSGTTTPTGPTVIPGGTVSTTYIISKPGSYVLGGNRHMTNRLDDIVQITARDVTLDLNGFVLSHSPGTASTENGSGIWVESTENVVIRNGSIVTAARAGIAAIGGGKGLWISDMRVIGPMADGIYITCAAAVVERTHVSDAGEDGIQFWGSETGRADDCVVSNSTSGGIIAFTGTLVRRAMISGGGTGVTLYPNSTLESSLVMSATGTGVTAAADTTVRDCHITKNKVGLSAMGGVALYGNRFSQNTTHVSGAYINAGGNVLP